MAGLISVAKPGSRRCSRSASYRYGASGLGLDRNEHAARNVPSHGLRILAGVMAAGGTAVPGSGTANLRLDKAGSKLQVPPGLVSELEACGGLRSHQGWQRLRQGVPTVAI